MNRAERRKHAMHIVNNAIKSKEKAIAKKQYGLGLIVTNLMIVIMFGNKTFTLMDRRLK